MEETDVLYPGKIKSMCAAAIADLNNDDLALDKAKDAIEIFVNDSNLNSLAYRTLKDQMEDYYDVITLLKAANGYDVEDYVTLLNSVGDLDLVGSEIIPEMNKAKEEEEYYISLYDEAVSKMNWYYDSISNIGISTAEKESNLVRYDYYFYQSKRYDLMAAWSNRKYSLYKMLADEYDRVNVETSGLFSESSALRASALDALDFLGKNYSNGQYGSLSGVKSYWLEPYYDQVEKDEEISELRDKLNISAEEYESMSDEKKVEYTNNAIDYLMMLTGNTNISPGGEIHVQLSDMIEVTYKVETSLNGVSCDNEFGLNNFGDVVSNINLGDISIDSEIDIQRGKLGEAKFILNSTSDGEAEGILNENGIGVGIIKTVGNDTYEGMVVSDFKSMTTSKVLTTQFDLAEDSCLELESEVDIKFSPLDYDADMKPAYSYEPVEELNREYDVEGDLAWLSLGGVGAAGAVTLTVLGGSVVISEAASYVGTGTAAVAAKFSDASAAEGIFSISEGLTVEEMITILSDVYQVSEVLPAGEDD